MTKLIQNIVRVRDLPQHISNLNCIMHPYTRAVTRPMFASSKFSRCFTYSLTLKLDFETSFMSRRNKLPFNVKSTDSNHI